MYELNEAVAQKVLQTVDAGLCKGKGVPIAGQMCVEAAVCFALGLPHSDDPPCVGEAVRAFKIRLNDSDWSDDKARALGMRRVAIAQLGSDKIDQKEFRKEMAIDTVRVILPIALRAAAKMVPSHAQALEASAVVCEAVIDIVTAKAASLKAKEVTQGARSAAAYTAAAYAAYTAAYTAADAADAAAYAAYAKRGNIRNSVLWESAEIAVQALIKLGSDGAKWLYLCDQEVQS